MTKGFMRNFSILSMALGSLLLASAPTFAAQTQSDAEKAAAAAAASSAVKVPVQAPEAAKAPAAPTVAAPAPVATPTPAAAPTTSVVAGELTISHPHMSYKKDHLDFFVSIKNASGSDERLGGAESPNSSGVVQVTKNKDGKEQEEPISVVLPAGKTTELSTDGTWLRIKDIKAEPKSTDVVPVTLYFRRSPNTTLKVPVKGGGDSGSVLDWLKK